MIKRAVHILFASIIAFYANAAFAGSESNEKLSKKNEEVTVNECFEKTSRAIFKFNQGLDTAIFEPIAKGYRIIPLPIRKGTSNAIDNLRSLLSFSNNILQGDFHRAGNTASRFLINSTVGILGIFDPAAAFGFEKNTREDFGQTLGVWGTGSGCYFVLPILGPTTTRDAIGLIGNVITDPVYQVTHNTEVMDRTYSEHNYYYYKGTDAVDFRSENIESFDSLEKNSIDLYASIKSIYIQNRNQKIANSTLSSTDSDDSDWEEIDNQ